MQTACCNVDSEQSNVSAYAAASASGWAGCCLQCGRTWPVDAAQAQDILKMRELAMSDGENGRDRG